ncbi:hypothetical protein AgCh_009751 [Apium graveolens]
MRFFQDGVMPHELNETNVVLTPMKKSPTEMGDLSPISLFTVLAKIVSKYMANIIKGFLQNLITEYQSAFMLDRLISDDIMISYEIMHHLKRNIRGKEGDTTIKVLCQSGIRATTTRGCFCLGPREPGQEMENGTTLSLEETEAKWAVPPCWDYPI